MKSCKYGYDEGRDQKRNCIVCSRIRSAKYYLENKEKAQIATKRWRENNPEKAKESIDNWAIVNKDKKNKKHKEYRGSERGRALHLASQNRRKAAKLLRIPKWANLEKIKLIYLKCPKGETVDHIIPLQGKLVSGLHVEYNLQYLTSSENSSKGNSFDTELFD